MSEAVRPRPLVLLLALLASIALLASACGDDDDAGSAADGIEITDQWARTSPAMATAGAAYMQITSERDDTLVAASVATSIAGSVEIHEVVPVEGDMGDNDMGDSDMTGDDMGESDTAGDDMGEGEMADEGMGEGEMDHGDGMDGDGMDMAMTMQELEGGLPLPAGETVTLEPGGYHVMLLDLPEPLEVGTSFDLELEFENAGVVTVAVGVRDNAP